MHIRVHTRPSLSPRPFRVLSFEIFGLEIWFLKYIAQEDETRENGMSKNSLKRLCNYKLYRCLLKEIRGENFSIEEINSSW